MLQACLNGGRRAEEAAGVPVTPVELGADARDAVSAGAECLHLHPRADDGSETLAPDNIAAALGAVRRAVPGVPVGISTAATIGTSVPSRHEAMRNWRVLPDYVSLNVHEDDAESVASLMAGHGVPIEAGVWTYNDIKHFQCKLDVEGCCRVLVEIGDMDEAAAREEAEAVLDGLDTQLPILLHGLGASAWPMVRMAAERGLDTRAGFEDMVTMPNGEPARSNAHIVAAAREILL